jgi:ribonucleotide reductase beta subunit family protein with ferritin-like domain
MTSVFDHVSRYPAEMAAMAVERSLVPFPPLPSLKGLEDMYEQQQANIWTARELSFAQDRDFFDRLTPSEQHVVGMVLAFFASADGMAAKVQKSFLNVFDAIPEAARLLRFQTMMEDIHAETYLKSLKSVLTDDIQVLQLAFGLVSVPEVKDKIDWARQYMNDDTLPLSVKMFAQACNEGIMFSSSFTILFYFRSKGVLPGISRANELISRDEFTHVQTYGLLERLLTTEPPSENTTDFIARIHDQPKIQQDQAHQILESAVQVEMAFAKYALAGGINGLPLEQMNQQIRWFANQVLSAYGFEPLYRGVTELDFMRMFGGSAQQNKANFFEKQSGTYSQAQVQIRADALPCAGDCV